MTADRVAGVLAAMTICLFGGCVSEEEPPRPMSQPMAPRADITLSELSVMTYAPIDADGDGYRETLTIEAFLITPEVDEPVAVRGTFTFTLFDRHEQVIHAWPPVTPDEAQRAVRTSRSLTVYRFLLILPPPPADQSLPIADSLAARFVPETGGQGVQTRTAMPITSR